MANREEIRNLETIPVGSLGLITLESCKVLGDKIDKYLVTWRTERENTNKNDQKLFHNIINPFGVLSFKI